MNIVEKSSVYKRKKGKKSKSFPIFKVAV